ncbi:MAG: hypothetical protein FWE35_00915 [Streptosporangiales bacterium]|nr:hypothetical protein [Streptosporangiales bacterium]
MSGETTATVWLYQAGEWEPADDPIDWGDETDVLKKYADAGYNEYGPVASSTESLVAGFLVMGLNSEDSPGYGAQITMYVRNEFPQCLIDIEGGAGSSRAVYAARLPDGLDIMARWAPLATAGMLTEIARGLMHPEEDSKGNPAATGLVETIARRVSQVV